MTTLAQTCSQDAAIWLTSSSTLATCLSSPLLSRATDLRVLLFHLQIRRVMTVIMIMRVFMITRVFMIARVIMMTGVMKAMTVMTVIIVMMVMMVMLVMVVISTAH